MAAPDFRFNGVVRLTRLGGGYLLFTLVIGFAALNTGNNALYIALSFMLATLLLSGIASKGGLRHIQTELQDVAEAWAGRPAGGLLRVRNRSRIWRVRDLVIDAPELAAPVAVPVVSRREEASVPVRFLFARRGRVALTRLDLYTRYPFGLFVKKRRTEFHGEWIVYPRLLEDISLDELMWGSRGETADDRRRGGGTELHAFRDYVEGDSVRHLHWKKSANVGRWIVRQPAHEVRRSLLIVVDDTLPPGVPAERFERMVSEVATLVMQGFDTGLEVSLRLPTVALGGRDSETRRAMLESLALLEPAWPGTLPAQESGSLVFTLRRLDEARSA